MNEKHYNDLRPQWHKGRAVRRVHQPQRLKPKWQRALHQRHLEDLIHIHVRDEPGKIQALVRPLRVIGPTSMFTPPCEPFVLQMKVPAGVSFASYIFDGGMHLQLL